MQRIVPAQHCPGTPSLWYLASIHQRTHAAWRTRTRRSTVLRAGRPWAILSVARSPVRCTSPARQKHSKRMVAIRRSSKSDDRFAVGLLRVECPRVRTAPSRALRAPQRSPTARAARPPFPPPYDPRTGQHNLELDGLDLIRPPVRADGCPTPAPRPLLRVVFVTCARRSRSGAGRSMRRRYTGTRPRSPRRLPRRAVAASALGAPTRIESRRIFEVDPLLCPQCGVEMKRASRCAADVGAPVRVTAPPSWKTRMAAWDEGTRAACK